MHNTPLKDNATPPCPNPPGSQPDAVFSALEYAWTIVCNAGGGNWKLESKDWQEAAARLRDDYYAILDARRHAPTAPLPTVAPHLAGLVERLEKQAAILRQAQIHCRSDGQEPFHWQDCVITITDAIAALTQLAGEVEEWKSNYSQQAQEVHKWRGLCAEWEERFHESDNEGGKLAAAIARLTAENEKLREQSFTDSNVIGVAHAEILRYRAQLQAATAERDALDAELQKLKAK